jgi:hypothetical protein
MSCCDQLHAKVLLVKFKCWLGVLDPNHGLLIAVALAWLGNSREILGH